MVTNRGLPLSNVAVVFGSPLTARLWDETDSMSLLEAKDGISMRQVKTLRVMMQWCFAASVIAFGGSPSVVMSDEVIHFADLDSFDNEAYSFEFSLGSHLRSIDSITVELSHSNAEQLDFTFENVGTGLPYVLFTLIDGDGSSTGNSVGVDDGDWGDFDGMSEITFVASGPSSTLLNAGDEAATGEYLADDWENHFGSGTPPYGPSRWRFRIEDTTDADDHIGSVGFIRINFTPVPEPAAAVTVSTILLVLGARRRRSH